MQIHYSTKQVPRRERLAFWEDMICATYANLQSTAHGCDDVYGAVSAVDIGHLQISTVQTTIPQVMRTARHIASDERAYLLVHLAQAGNATIEHRSRRVQLAPGEMVAYMTPEPYRLTFQHWSNTRVIKLPLDTIIQLLPGVEDLVGMRVPADTAELRVLSALTDSVWNHRGGLEQGYGFGITEAVRQAVAAALGTLRTHANTRPSNLELFHLNKAKEFIEKHLQSESLSAQDIASGIGISVRHLSRLFTDHSKPLHRYVLEAKLRGCIDELRCLQAQRGAIQSVAYAWGFSSPSHFSRVFRSVWGKSPTEWLAAQTPPPVREPSWPRTGGEG